MHAVRARGQRYVGAIVHEHLRAASLRPPSTHRLTSAVSVPRVEIALAHLNQIDARTRRGRHEIDQPIDGIRPQPTGAGGRSPGKS